MMHPGARSCYCQLTICAIDLLDPTVNRLSTRAKCCQRKVMSAIAKCYLSLQSDIYHCSAKCHPQQSAISLNKVLSHAKSPRYHSIGKSSEAASAPPRVSSPGSPLPAPHMSASGQWERGGSDEGKGGRELRRAGVCVMEGGRE
eukprot:3559314-Rhodomonas_salina.1